MQVMLAPIRVSSETCIVAQIFRRCVSRPSEFFPMLDEHAFDLGGEFGVDGHRWIFGWIECNEIIDTKAPLRVPPEQMLSSLAQFHQHVASVIGLGVRVEDN